MKRIALTLAALVAVSCFAAPAEANGGFFRQRQRVVVRHHAVRQQVVVQKVVAAPVVYAQPVVAVQAVHAVPVVQQFAAPHCSSFFVK